MTDPRYPIGPFEAPATFSAEGRGKCITQIAEAPALLRDAVAGLSASQLQQPYRDGGRSVGGVGVGTNYRHRL